MALPGPKATSVTQEGDDDGFVVSAGWTAEATPAGDTRIVASVPLDDLPRVHAALVSALAPPLGFLYRQEVDRKNPRPAGAPPRDRVALELAPARVLAALESCAPLVYSDARCEIWIRGRMSEQVVLDHDGVLFCYPDDPAFRTALEQAGVPAVDVEMLHERDYVKHWFRAEADPFEDELARMLGLSASRP